MPSHATSSLHSKDLYQILRVSHAATLSEIKLAYYQIAQQLHPDKHNGCSTKMESFKQVNEAYSILSDPSQRHAYDFTRGYTYNRNRRTAPPKDYRKVYMARPPPHWKTVWDHAKHYEMHYGNGMQQEAIRQAMKTAESEGAFEYRSPLGKGFTFDHVTTESSSTTNTTGNRSSSELHGSKYNPYSKRTPQGPPKVVFEYSEGDNFTSNGREQMRRHERIVRDMHSRRHERMTRHHQQNHHDYDTARTNMESSSSSSHGGVGGGAARHRSSYASNDGVSPHQSRASTTKAQWPYSQYQAGDTNRSDTDADKDSCSIM